MTITEENLQVFRLKPSYGYRITSNSGLATEGYSSGSSRVRAGLVNQSSKVRVQYPMAPEETSYVRSFFRTRAHAVTGSPYFRAYIVFDDGGAVELRTVCLIGDFEIIHNNFGRCTLDLELEIKPSLADTEFDISLVELYTMYDGVDQIYNLVNGLEKLVNVTMPESLS